MQPLAAKLNMLAELEPLVNRRFVDVDQLVRGDQQQQQRQGTGAPRR